MNFFKILFLFVLIVLSPYLTFSQVKLSGKVINEASRAPISLVNVAIPGTYYGTITNNDGVFSLTIPSKYSGRKLIFSCIGFQSDTIPISKIQSGLIIKLEERVNELSEVIVMPENKLRKLLQRAYDKIPENYPVTNTRYKGFYRETVKDDHGNYISFGEALIESVRGSVNLRNDKGQIKIVKSRGGYFPGKDSTTVVRFYGGVFQSTKDFVQNRSGFINPSNFKDYRYSVQKVDNFYKINFRKKDTKHAMAGYFLLDTLSLAYTEAAYYRERNEDEIIFKRLDAEYYYKFVEISGRYFLKYNYFKGEGFDKFRKKKFHHFDEYLATEIFPDYFEKIPEKEQVNYFDVFIDQIPDYSDTFWEGNTIVEADSLLTQSQLTQREINAIVDQRKNTKRREKRLAIISKLSFKYGVTYSSMQVAPGTYEFKLSSVDQSFTKKIEEIRIWNLNSAIGYFFSPHFAVTYVDESSVVNDNVYRNSILALEFKEKINSFGVPNYFSLKTGIGRATSLLEIGTFKNPGRVKWGSKNLDANRISAFVGDQSWIFKPTIGFSRHLKGKSSLFLDFSYSLAFASKEVFAMKEKSGLFRKLAIEGISESENQIYRNGQLISQTRLETPEFLITLGINLLR